MSTLICVRKDRRRTRLLIPIEFSGARGAVCPSCRGACVNIIIKQQKEGSTKKNSLHYIDPRLVSVCAVCLLGSKRRKKKKHGFLMSGEEEEEGEVYHRSATRLLACSSMEAEGQSSACV